MGLDHKLFLQLFVIGFCLFSSRIGKTGNPQQILAYSWYIFKSFIKSFFQIQNTIRLS